MTKAKKRNSERIPGDAITTPEQNADSVQVGNHTRYLVLPDNANKILPIEKGVLTLESTIDDSTLQYHSTFKDARGSLSSAPQQENTLFGFADKENLYIFRGLQMLMDSNIVGEITPHLPGILDHMNIPAHGHLYGGLSIYDETKWVAKINYGVLDDKIRAAIESLRQ